MRLYRAIPVGKPIKSENFVYGWYSEEAGKSYIAYVRGVGVSFKPEVIPSTVGQQVGLKDRDDKEEVYEDDLMKDLLHTYRVCWAELDAGFRLIDIEEPKNQLRGAAIRLLTKMGTIHDEEAE